MPEVDDGGDDPTSAFNQGRFQLRLQGPHERVPRLWQGATSQSEVWDRLNAAPVGTTFCAWGYFVRVNPGHLKPRELEPWRQVGDPLANAAVRALAAARVDRQLDSVHQLRALRHELPAADAFLSEAEAVPAWVDLDRVARGQDFFRRHLPALSLALLNLSLVGGFGSPRINRVLQSTAYLTGSRDATYRRLWETVQMIQDCMGTGSLMPWERGWVSTLNVRLLHAGVRCYLLDRCAWDSGSLGVPINVEDMVVTQLAFSIILLMGLERVGLMAGASDGEMNDYLHLWRYIGHLSGIPPAQNGHMDDIHDAQTMLESIGAHVVAPDASSPTMTWHVLECVSNRPPLPRSMAEMVACSRLLAGDLYADALGIPAMDDDRLHAPPPPMAIASTSWWYHSILWMYLAIGWAWRIVASTWHWAAHGSPLSTAHQPQARAQSAAAALFARLQLAMWLARVPLLGSGLGWCYWHMTNRLTVAHLHGRTDFRLRMMPKPIPPGHPEGGKGEDAPVLSGPCCR